MINNSHSLPDIRLLPRLKALPPSDFLPLIFLSIPFLLICLAAIVPAQSIGANYVAANYTNPSKSTESINSREHRVFDLINNERVTRGLQPLIWIEQAAAAARSHSTNMAECGYFSHADLSGRRVDDRADEFGLSDWRRLGENIAWLSGYDDPVPKVVDGWMQSPGHRENILNSKYRESGIGIAVSREGQYYFTQVFVLRK